MCLCKEIGNFKAGFGYAGSHTHTYGETHNAIIKQKCLKILLNQLKSKAFFYESTGVINIISFVKQYLFPAIHSQWIRDFNISAIQGKVV